MSVTTWLLLILFYVLVTRLVASIPAFKGDSIVFAALVCVVVFLLLRG